MSRAALDRRTLVAVGLATAAGTIGCVDTDPAVFVDATIEGPSATLAEGTLVTTITGALSLWLHLGPRASGAAEVSLGQVSLTSADGVTSLVSPLAVGADPAFPVTVEPDSDVVVGITFAPADNELATDTYDTVCSAGELALVVALDDSLRGGTLRVTSPAFLPEGCP